MKRHLWLTMLACLAYCLDQELWKAIDYLKEQVRVPLIKGFDHLVLLCMEFEHWYNAWRPHITLEVLRPDDLYYKREPEKPKRNAKSVPSNIRRHVFVETRLTAYRLKAAA